MRADAAAQLRMGWLRAIGAPDYKAYLTHHAARHPGTPPMASVNTSTCLSSGVSMDGTLQALLVHNPVGDQALAVSGTWCHRGALPTA